LSRPWEGESRIIAYRRTSLWEIAGTLLALAAGIYALRWLAGKIFRVGMLSYGQQASLRDLGRWLRA